MEKVVLLVEITMVIILTAYYVPDIIVFFMRFHLTFTTTLEMGLLLYFINEESKTDSVT